MQQMQLVTEQYNGMTIMFEGHAYINATQVCKQFPGKKPDDFIKTARTQRRIKAISKKFELDENQLVIVRKGSPENGGGTWLHPKLAVAFADWLDDDFGLWCDEQIEKILKGDLAALPQWRKNLQDRLDYNPIPLGFPYFSVFRESLDVIHAMAKTGLPIDPHNMLDSSIGTHWSKNWYDKKTGSGLHLMFPDKPRIKYPHNFPPNYPQSKGPDIEAWVYPIEALSAFHRWLAEKYIPEKLEPYLKGKVRKGDMTMEMAKRIKQTLLNMLHIEHKH